MSATSMPQAEPTGTVIAVRGNVVDARFPCRHGLAGRMRALSAGARPQPKVADGAIEALGDLNFARSSANR